MNSLLRKTSLALKHRKTLLNILKYKCQLVAGQIPQYPLLINIYITEKCNAGCDMCHIYDARMKHLRRANGRGLDPIRLMEVINKGRRFQPMYYITGGEPLIYDNLFDVVKTIKQNRSIVALTSNGIKLNECYKDIVDEGIDYISLSLDGSTSEAHDKNKYVAGAFDRLVGGLKKLIQYRGKRFFPNIKINTVIRRENLDDLVDTYRLAQSLGVDQFELEHYAFYAQAIKDLAQKESIKYGLGDEVHGAKIGRRAYMNSMETARLEQVIKELRSLAKRSKVQFLINHDGKDLYRYYSGEMHSKKSSCDEVFKTIKIRQSGQVEICQGIVIGNIYENTLTDIWRSKRNGEVLTHFLKNKCSVACYRCCSLNIKFNSNNNQERWYAHLAD